MLKYIEQDVAGAEQLEDEERVYPWALSNVIYQVSPSVTSKLR
jgi:hypothetical protein